MASFSSSWGKYLWHRMCTKHEAHSKDLKTDLVRCLSTWQLILLGMGNTIGVGIYVMLGVMIKEEAGPSVIFSFVIAIVVTWMNAMVFAEFSTYIPQTGASYMFLYKTFGEFAAFLVGSLAIISGLLCGSVGARAWSGMLDSFFNNTLQDHTIAVLGKVELGPPFSESLDFVACIFQLVIMAVVLFNILCTSVINTVLGILTSSVLIFVFFIGVTCGDSQNFLNSENGGIFPFGAVGVMKAASMALYATSGFEIVSMSSEECKTPAKSIPRAIVAELLLVGLIYIAASVGMMFLIPYWMIDLRAPLPSAFEYSGQMWGKMIVTVGPMFGITNLQMLGLYCLSRSIYRMSKDGLIFSFFLKVDSRTGVPQRAVLFPGLLMSIFALLFDLTYIVKMSLILMLTSYIFVAAALIRLKVDESKSLNPNTSAVSYNGKAADFSLSADGDEETLFSREISDISSLAEGEEYENSKRRNKGGTFLNFSDQTEFENESKTHPEEHLNQESENKLFSPENSEKLYGGRITDKTGEEADLVDLSEIQAESEQPLVQNSNQYEPVKQGKVHSGLYLSSPNPQGVTTQPGSAQFPGVPPNVLIGLHVLTCLTLSGQVIYGWEDLQSQHAVAVLACAMLVVLIILFSALLGLVCSRSHLSNSSKDRFFQTPLMPLVPTCSIVLSSLMLFSAAEKVGCVEVVLMIVVVSVIYILMTFVEYKSNYRKDLKGPALQEAHEQEMRLISPDDETDETFYDTSTVYYDDDEDWQ